MMRVVERTVSHLSEMGITVLLDSAALSQLASRAGMFDERSMPSRNSRLGFPPGQASPSLV